MKFLNHNLFTGDITVNGTTTLSTATGITRSTGDNTTHLATTAFVKAQDYATNTALGNYVPVSRTLTINNVTYDLSANRSWTIGTSDYTSVVKHAVKAGVAITKGQAIYVTSADGTNMIVGLASNATEATSSKTMGLAETTVAANGFTNVITEGLLAGLNTVGANAGDPVWLGTGGNLIYGLLNKPYAPAHLVFIGIVTRVNANNGEIFVKIQNGFELKEIHDVDLITTAPINGHLLGYNGTLWVNKTIAGWLGYTPANASGTTNYISKFTGTTTLGNSQIFDNGTNVGIGTTSPSFKLHVEGDSYVNGVLRISSANPLYFNDYGGGWYMADSSWVRTYNAKSVWVGGGLLGGDGGLTIGYGGTGSPSGGAIIAGNVGIGTTSPQKPLEVISAANDFVSIGVNQIGVGNWTGIHFGYRESNTSYRKSAIVFERTDLTSNNAQGKVHILNGPQAGAGSATLADSKLTIAENGNVGIGTTAPLGTLDIGKSSATPSLVIGNSSYPSTYNSVWGLQSGAQSIMIFGNNGQNEIRAGGTGVGGYLDFYTNNTAVFTAASNGNFAMRLAANGNVGIGTTSPANKLQVANGDMSITSGYSFILADTDTNWRLGRNIISPVESVYLNSNTFEFVAANASDQGWQFINDDGYPVLEIGAATGSRNVWVNAGNLLVPTGSVGIGTTSPVSGQGTPLTLASSTGYVGLTLSGSGAYSHLWQLYASGDGGSNKFFGIYDSTNAAYRLVTTSSGNVGIGTTDPTSQMSGTFGIGIYNALYPAVGFKNSTTAWLWYGQGSTFKMWNVTAGDILTANTSGNVGIGTTAPTFKLDVNGTFHSGGDATFNGTNTYINSSYIYVGNNASDLVSISGNTMYLPGNGNVGIGTISPGQKLQIDSPLRTEFYGTDSASPADAMNIVGTGASRALGTGSALLFSVPANTDGTNMWAQARILGTGDNSSNGSAEGAMFLQTRALYNPGVGGSWNWRTNMVLRASGNVGIGTSSPGTKLDVNGVITATGGNSTNWNTAYSWGNHASAGYLTSYTETDTLATVTARGSSTNGSIFINGVFTGGLGAVTTSGTLDWNDVSNARAGQGYTLLLGTATNGMGSGQYYHPVSFEYSSKNGSGNMTQLAIPYTGNGIWYRNRYGGSWSSWARVWDDSSFTSTNISNWNTAYGWGNHASQGYATQTYVNTAIANLVDAAPSTLDTLNELAAALGDDPNFATTVTNSIAAKLPLAGGTMSGTISFINDIGTALQGTVGINDYWRIYANSTTTNAGYLEIATSDDGTEPIYVRQYTGVFSSLTRTATLLDGSGNTSLPGSLTVGGTITENSSIRYKENVVDLESATEKVEQLRAVRYNKIGHEIEEIGLIAEEVAEVYPEVVNYNEEGQPDGVNYTRLSVILLKAVQELTERINKLESK